MKVGLVVPHIFMQSSILPDVIFSPGQLALELADELIKQGIEVTLFTPGPVNTKALNVNVDLSSFERELASRGDTYLELLKKHPLTFITLARQVQSELLAKAFRIANENQLDIIHIYTNEEDTALHFADFCQKPVVFTHHDPFNFLVNYKHLFPKFRHLNWISMSYAQRQTMPKDTNWVANIYHGLNPKQLCPTKNPANDYIAYLGRIIEPKGVHLAIDAVQAYNKANPENRLKLNIAGKHYGGHNNSYWQKHIEPALVRGEVEYVGYIRDKIDKQAYLGNARALIVPSVFDEPFGMVAIEALACGTPVIGLDSGALPEVITHGKTGIVVKKQPNQSETIDRLASALKQIDTINRTRCRQDFEKRFSLSRMAKEHADLYQRLQDN